MKYPAVYQRLRQGKIQGRAVVTPNGWVKSTCMPAAAKAWFTREPRGRNVGPESGKNATADGRR